MNYGQAVAEFKERLVAPMGYQVECKGAQIKKGTDKNGNPWKMLNVRFKVVDTNPSGVDIDIEVYKNPICREYGGEEVTLFYPVWLPTTGQEKWKYEQSMIALKKFANDLNIELPMEDDEAEADKMLVEACKTGAGAVAVVNKQKDYKDPDSAMIWEVSSTRTLL